MRLQISLMFSVVLIGLQASAALYGSAQCVMSGVKCRIDGALVDTQTQPDHERKLRPFITDGCSMSPDGIWGFSSNAFLKCCEEHDLKYWIGGSRKDKEEADENLRSCMEKTGHPQIATLYKWAVTRFSSDESNLTYRWGYGWSQQRSFKPLEKWEIEEAERLTGTPLTLFFDKTLKSDPEIASPGLSETVEMMWSNDEILIFEKLKSVVPSGTQIKKLYAKNIQPKYREYFLSTTFCSKSLEIKIVGEEESAQVEIKIPEMCQ